jgi:hypothetical protein
MVTIRWKILVPNEGASLCGTCIWGVVRKGYRAGDVETFCRLVGPNALAPFPVSECIGYTDRRSPDSAVGCRIGFISAASVRETKYVEIVPVTSDETKED